MPAMKSHGPRASRADDAPSAAERIAASPLRVTENRVMVLSAIEAQSEPVTVETLIRYFLKSRHSISVGTAYRVLSDLADAGLLIRQWIDGVAGPRVVYLARQNASQVASHRLICRVCRSEVQFFSSELTPCITRSLGKNLLGSANHSLDILYCCAKCAEPD